MIKLSLTAILFSLPVVASFALKPLPSPRPVFRTTQTAHRPTNMQDIRCVIVGDTSVGKSCLIISNTTGAFPGEYYPHILENHNANWMIDGKPTNFVFLDTGAAEDDEPSRILHYPHADVVMICFSVVSPSSFESVETKWRPEIERLCPNVPIVLVGTKVDLREERGTVDRLSKENLLPITHDQGLELSLRIGASRFFECSALTQENLRPTFFETSRIVFALRSKNSHKKDRSCLIA